MNPAYFEHENPATRECPFLQPFRKNLAARVHVHSELEIVMVLSGAVECVLDGNAVTLSAGDILTVLPWEVHSYHSFKASVTHLMKLYAPPELLSVRVGDRGHITAGDLHYGDFRTAIETIAREECERREGYTFFIAAETNRLLALILRALSPVRVSENEQKDIRLQGEFILRFERYMEAHYTEPISLDDAAAHMHYSRYYFAHRFREIMGQSFLDYVTQFRLERASALLLSGESVLDTALACGFGNVRSFHRAFRKHHGVSPAERKGKYAKKT